LFASFKDIVFGNIVLSVVLILAISMCSRQPIINFTQQVDFRSSDNRNISSNTQNLEIQSIESSASTIVQQQQDNYGTSDAQQQDNWNTREVQEQTTEDGQITPNNSKTKDEQDGQKTGDGQTKVKPSKTARSRRRSV